MEQHSCSLGLTPVLEHCMMLQCSKCRLQLLEQIHWYNCCGKSRHLLVCAEMRVGMLFCGWQQLAANFRLNHFIHTFHDCSYCIMIIHRLIMHQGLVAYMYVLRIRLKWYLCRPMLVTILNTANDRSLDSQGSVQPFLTAANDSWPKPQQATCGNGVTPAFTAAVFAGYVMCITAGLAPYRATSSPSSLSTSLTPSKSARSPSSKSPLSSSSSSSTPP